MHDGRQRPTWQGTRGRDAPRRDAPWQGLERGGVPPGLPRNQARPRPGPGPGTPPGPSASDLHLSLRELEILGLLCQAHSNAEIATALHLSESTVKTHVSSIMAKLMVPSRLKAVIRAYELGLVTPA